MKSIVLIFALFFYNLCLPQSIEKFSIDSGGASASNGNIEVLYTLGEVNVQELNAGNIAVSEGFISPNFIISIDAKVFLQGPLLNPDTPGLMNDDLRVLNYIPTTSPYADAATAAASVFDLGGTSGTGLPQDDIVDWVSIEIRRANDNSKVTRSRSALLQRDGDIVDVDGVSTVTLNAAPTYYYIVVKHRNHLAAMSSATLVLSEDSAAVVDFKDSGFTTFGSNARVQLGSGDMALWTGDTNNTDQVRFSGANNSTNVIKDHILADPANILNFITFGSTGYLDLDVDLNGISKFSGSENDSNIIKDNVLAHPGNILNFLTYTISSTVPPDN
jgi:hypothetical protein